MIEYDDNDDLAAAWHWRRNQAAERRHHESQRAVEVERQQYEQTDRETSDAWQKYIDERIAAAVDTAVQVVAEETARTRNADRKLLKQYVGEQFARWNFVATNPEMRRVGADIVDLMRQRKDERTGTPSG